MAGKTCKGAGTDLSNHAPPSLVALTVCSPLLLLLQYAFPTSPILKGKLSQRVTELHDAYIPSCLCGVAEVEQEGMEPRQVGRSGRLVSLPGVEGMVVATLLHSGAWPHLLQTRRCTTLSMATRRVHWARKWVRRARRAGASSCFAKLRRLSSAARLRHSSCPRFSVSCSKST